MKKIIAAGLVLGLVLSMAVTVSAGNVDVNKDDIALPPIPPVKGVPIPSDPVTLNDIDDDDIVVPPVPPDVGAAPSVF